jgi:DNA polymerase-3 subunit alpha (Gram-positive type)
VYLKLSGELNGGSEKLRKALEEFLGARVVFGGENFRSLSLEGFLSEKLRNGMRMDIRIDGDEVLIRVPGEFAKERVKKKIVDLKKELKAKFKRNLRIKIKVDEKFFKELEKSVEKTSKISLKEFKPVEPKEIESEEKDLVFGKKPRKTVHFPSSLPPTGNEISVMGEVFKIEERSGKRRSLLLYITDKNDSMIVRVSDKYVDKTLGRVKVGDGIVATGILDTDPSLSGDPVLVAKGLSLVEMEKRTDTAETKRIELHAHTKYSDLDAVLDIKEYVKRLKEWGHKAAAITDHGNVQGIIEFYHEARDAGIKPILGMEGYLVNDVESIYHGDVDGELSKMKYVVLDL